MSDLLNSDSGPDDQRGPRRVAAVVLNYDTPADLARCLELLSKQRGVRLSIIVVDNGSRPENLERVRTWLRSRYPDAAKGTEEQVLGTLTKRSLGAAPSPFVCLVENSRNLGYSAGNNCGIRVAMALGSEAVLIVNPDVVIEDQAYVAALTEHLFAAPEAVIAASRITDILGREQNPLREMTFLEEVLWPRHLFQRFLGPPCYVVAAPQGIPSFAEKLSGCCLLLRTTFLNQIGLLDEGVFLYCEEPILAAQAAAGGGRLLFVPTMRATHAHVASTKGSATRRMLLFIKSRLYYLKAYSSYRGWRLGCLRASYALMAASFRVRGVFRR